MDNLKKEYLNRIHAKNRFGNTSIFIKNLILAEEELLIVQGWEPCDISGNYSTWKNSEFIMKYSRNQAILMLKASTHDIGIH